MARHKKEVEELNPAIAPAPLDPPHAKCYEVTGEATVFGFEPGAKFNATLSFEQEADFTFYGHLAVVSDEPDPDVATYGAWGELIQPEPEEEGDTVAEDSGDSANDDNDKE